MNFEEFKFLIHRVTLLSDKVAGLKTQNKELEKKVIKLQKENLFLESKCETLGAKLTELNHENNKLKKRDALPDNFHGKIHIHDVK